MSDMLYNSQQDHPDWGWRQDANVAAGRSPWFNSVMFEAGLMTEEEAQAIGEKREAQISRMSDANVYGIDLSDEYETQGGVYQGTSASGMGFKDWMESQGLWESYLAGNEPMAFDSWALGGGGPMYQSDPTTQSAMGGVPAGTVATSRVGSEGFGGEGTGTSKGDFTTALSAIGIPLDLADELWGWAQEKVLDPTYDLANITLDLQQTNAFKQRFPAIDMMRSAEVTPVSPSEYINFETNVKKLLTKYNIEGQSLNFDGLITSLLVNTVGEVEVENRLNSAMRVLGNVPPEVTDMYYEWFGEDVGISNLMKTFLDPNDEWGGSWQEIQDEVATAEVGGWARMRLNLDTSMDIREESAKAIAQQGLTQREIWAKLDNLQSKSALFAEKIGEEDLSIEQEGIEQIFGVDDSESVEQREEERRAEFAGGGGAMVTGTTTGFGGSNA
tara:strand:+ start:1986 stop:3314 length:1329 start_codon:yes stop_codon:yes gene_type:complete